MTERIDDGKEREVSPLQQHLIDSARELLQTSPKTAVSQYETGSQFTPRFPRVQRVLGKIAQNPDKLLYYFLNDENIKYSASKKALSLRAATGRDTNDGILYAWASSVELIQEIKRDLQTNIKHESLTIRAWAAVDNPRGATNLSSIIDETLWYNDLLKPIDDPSEIERLQAEIDLARER